MIKFFIVSRRQPGQTLERCYYEWSVIHVALMVTTPSVMRTFRKYVQHFAIQDVDASRLVMAPSSMGWETFADHWLHRFEDLLVPFQSGDYPLRMQPHKFTDSAFQLALATGDVIREREGFAPGGVKLIHFLRKKPALASADFHRYWREQHAPIVLQAIPGIRKYVQNRPLALPASAFNGTLFEMGEVDRYTGVEEFWFDDIDDVYRLKDDPQICRALQASYGAFVDLDDAFSMVMNERVVFDYTLPPGRCSPRAAVLDAGSLEAAIDAQGYTDWVNPNRAPGRSHA